MKYDFFVLQSATGAGLALGHFLAVHPELYVPHRDLTDKAFEQGVEAVLASSDLIPAGRPWPKQLGLMLHSNVQLRDDLPARVAALMQDGARLVQLVRDPAEVLVATHRRLLLASATDELCRKLGRPGVQGAPRHVPNLARIYEARAERLHYHHQGARFAARICARFDRWIVLDSAELWPDRVDATLRLLFERLGVRPGVSSALFRKDFQGVTTKLLHFSLQAVSVAGVPLAVRLERTRDIPWSPGRFTRELAQVDDVSRRLSFPFPSGPVSLVTSDDQWARLPESTRQGLKGGLAMQRHLETVLLPQWIEQVEQIHAEVVRRWRRELPASLRARMRRELDADLSRLFELRPELERRWDWGSAQPPTVAHQHAMSA